MSVDKPGKPQRTRYSDTEGLTPQDVIDQCTHVLDERDDPPTDPDILTLYIMVKGLAEEISS